MYIHEIFTIGVLQMKTEDGDMWIQKRYTDGDNKLGKMKTQERRCYEENNLISKGQKAGDKKEKLN